MVDVDFEETRETPILEAGAQTELPGPVTVGQLVEGARKGVSQVGTTARRLVDRGRYRKVRISRNGKAVLPDIPLAALAAAEAASLYGAGFARVLAAHVGARFLFDIEVVNEADRFYKHGVDRFLEGDWEEAEESLLKAVKIDDSYAAAYLQLGVLYRLIHEPGRAREVLLRARALDETGEIGRKATDILKAL